MSTTVSHQVPTAQQQAISDLTGYEDAATLRWQQACVQAANTLTALPNGRYVNVRMERMRQGLELAQRIARHELPVKVVIVTTFARAGFLRRALDAGVVGYLLKDAPAERLAEALRKVRHGGRAIDPELAVEAWGEADPLNDRERQVLRLAGEGRTSGEIAAQLNLSQGTVRNYLSEAIGKLGAGNRIEAARLARQKGWL